MCVGKCQEELEEAEVALVLVVAAAAVEVVYLTHAVIVFVKGARRHLG